MEIKKNIEAWVNESLEGSDAFIYDIQYHAGDKINIYLDADDGVNIHRCADVHRFVMGKLDEQNPEHPYSIDVSSPGVDRPLKFQRQYKKHLGRKLDVTLNDGKVLNNMLKEVKDDSIVIGEKVTNLLTKRKPKPDIEIPFADIRESMVVVSFS